MRGSRFFLAAILLLSAICWAQSNQPPVAISGPDRALFLEDLAQLEGSAVDPDGDPVTAWTWTIERHPPGSNPVLSDENEALATFLTDTAGEYVLSLIAFDGQDWGRPDFMLIRAAENQPPVGVAKANVTCGWLPLTVHFDGSDSNDPEGEDLAFGWDFGDSSEPSQQISPTHVYEDPGSYAAGLTVQDDRGQIGWDSLEVYVLIPDGADEDGDGVPDPCDNCSAIFNPAQDDCDDNRVGDACDVCPCDPFKDADFDMICAPEDNCPWDANTNQLDFDSDGAGEVCDNCPAVYNSTQADRDSDGIGDACDACTDQDGDGYGDPGFPAGTCTPDNCPEHANLDQADTDADGYGDVCDCAPYDPHTRPGAHESNDGLDNQCPGDFGLWIVDEISGRCGFRDPADPTVFSWPMQLWAATYQVARSTTPDFTGGCLLVSTAELEWPDAEEPQSGAVFHYLVRALSPNDGCWGDRSGGYPRWPNLTCPE